MKQDILGIAAFAIAVAIGAAAIVAQAKHDEIAAYLMPVDEPAEVLTPVGAIDVLQPVE